MNGKDGVERRRRKKGTAVKRLWLIPLFACLKQDMRTFEESGRKSSRKEYKM
jgi:hypothetical protein